MCGSGCSWRLGVCAWERLPQYKVVAAARHPNESSKQKSTGSFVNSGSSVSAFVVRNCHQQRHLHAAMHKMLKPTEHDDIEQLHPSSMDQPTPPRDCWLELQTALGLDVNALFDFAMSSNNTQTKLRNYCQRDVAFGHEQKHRLIYHSAIQCLKGRPEYALPVSDLFYYCQCCYRYPRYKKSGIGEPCFADQL